MCRSVLEQDTEPLTAPDEQVGALHGVLRHRCVSVCVCEWVNVKYIVKHFGEKRYIKCSPFTIYKAVTRTMKDP